jgi:uncharacterized membrane protein
MSDRTVMILIMFVDVALAGGFVLIYPRIMRRGLLFGVYVGEERSQSDEARAITRAWYRGTLAAIAAVALLSLALALYAPNPLWTAVPTLALTIAVFGVYLQAYQRARGLAAPEAAHVAAAPLVVAPERPAILPWIAIVAGVACGIWAIAYTASRYDALPDPMPTHFGPSGKPDGWSAKSFGSVMILPIMTLVMGILMGGSAILVAKAKRAIRLDKSGRSLEAQNRFRAALSNFLAVMALLVTALLGILSVGAVQVALGERSGLPGTVMLIGLGLFVFSIVGVAWMMIKYGQGGSRLEGPAAGEALTDGLADNKLWKLGVFYVNREDPSWLVEHRFGFGYTLNLGNPKAVATFVIVFGAIIGLAIWAAVAS